MQSEIHKILIGLVSVLVFGGGLFGFFVVRLVRGYDEKIRELFAKIEDLPAIRKDIEWLKNGRK